VLGAAQILAAGMKSLPAEPQTERMLKSVGSIGKSVARMIRLANDLLDLSSIDAHQLHLEIRPELPGELVAEAADAHGVAATEHRLRLVVSVEEGLPFVRCDRERLSQVFANLLANAFKYSPPATTVTIAAAHEEGCVRFSVADEGLGIAEQELPHVFNRYWRGAVSAGRSRGLGLAIVKGIIEGHGGRVGVTSQVGKGSTFFFALPSGLK
jgi:signal transduction histidine kinase